MFKSSTIFKLFSIFSFVIFGIVFLKLFYLQVIQGEKYDVLITITGASDIPMPDTLS